MLIDEQLKNIITASFPLKRFLYNKNDTIYCELHALPKLMLFLRDDIRCSLNLIDIYAFEKKGKFEISYFLKSRRHGTEAIIRTEAIDKIPSIHHLFPNALKLECEVFDMHGIIFEGNPDLRRTLTSYSYFGGHPLKKDFNIKGIAAIFYNQTTKTIDCEEVTNDNK